jgi:hypothetical protein
MLQQFDPHVVIQPLPNGTCVKLFETPARVFRNLTSHPRGNTQVGGRAQACLCGGGARQVGMPHASPAARGGGGEKGVAAASSAGGLAS